MQTVRIVRTFPSGSGWFVHIFIRFCVYYSLVIIRSHSFGHTSPVRIRRIRSIWSWRNSQDSHWLRRFASLYTAFYSSTKTVTFGYTTPMPLKLKRAFAIGHSTPTSARTQKFSSIFKRANNVYI